MSLKRYISLFILSVTLLAANIAFASNNDSCQKAIKSFFREGPVRLVPQSGSVFKKYPELLSKMEKLHHTELNYVLFVKEFSKIYKRQPSIREGLHFIYQYQAQFYKNYIWFYKELEKIQDPIVNDLKKELLTTMKKIDHYKSFKNLEDYADKFADNLGVSLNETIIVEQQKYIYVPHHRILVESSRINYLNAEFGELYALATTGNRIVSRGMHFAANLDKRPNAYEQMIYKAVTNLEVKFDRASMSELINLVNAHHDGFFRKAYAYIRKTPAHKLDKNHLVLLMINMVRSKEIDLVSTKNGNIYYWSEVKALAKPITLQSLMNHPSHKPMYNQLLEHKILRDLLGLENHVHLVFVSTTSQIAPEAVEALKQLGYIAVGAR